MRGVRALAVAAVLLVVSCSAAEVSAPSPPETSTATDVRDDHEHAEPTAPSSTGPDPDGGDHDGPVSGPCVLDRDTTTTVTLWHSLGGDQTFEALDELVATFALQHPEIELEVVRVEGYESALRTFRDTSPDQLPDLFMASIDSTRLLAESGRFVPPSVCTGVDPPVLDDLLPVIRDTVTIDGRLQAYPFNVSTPVLLYDPSLLDGLAVDPENPAADLDTWRELMVDLDRSGLAPAGLALYHRSASWLIEQWAVHHGHVLVEPDNAVAGHPVDGVRFVTDEAVQALEWARQLYLDGLVAWVGLNQSSIDDLLKLIDLADRASFTLHTSAAIGDLVWLVYTTGLADLEGAELGVAPIPSPVGVTGSLVGGGSLWLLDHGDAGVLGAAAHVAEFLMSPSSQAAFAAATGYVPATTSAAEHPITVARWQEFPQFAVPYRQLVDTPQSVASTGMQIGPRVEVQRVLEVAVAEVIVEGADPRARLEAAEVEALEVIRRYERDQGIE